jgi:biopolymer transport protein ExbD
MKKTSRSHHSTLNELNITPLLDLVFVLLVIFIITTPQLMNNLEMNLPSGKPPPKKADQPKINKIAVDGRGQITFNSEVVTVAQLKSMLQQGGPGDRSRRDSAIARTGGLRIDHPQREVFLCWHKTTQGQTLGFR